MKTKITAAILTAVLSLVATAGFAADRLQTRSRTQTPSSTCTPGTGTQTRTHGGR